MNEFEIFNETNYNVDKKYEKGLIEYALNFKNLNNVIFNVIFVDNKTINKIKKEYRGIDR